MCQWINHNFLFLYMTSLICCMLCWRRLFSHLCRIKKAEFYTKERSILEVALTLSNGAVSKQNTFCKMEPWSYFYITIGIYVVIVIISLFGCVMYFNKCGLCRNCKRLRTLNASRENVEANAMNGINENTTQSFPEYRRGLYEL